MDIESKYKNNTLDELAQILATKTQLPVVVFYTGLLIEEDGITTIDINKDIDIDDHQSLLTLMNTSFNSTQNEGILMINSLGGKTSASIEIAKLLARTFENLYVFVFNDALSSGTLISFAGTRLFMYGDSTLSPIDAQFPVKNKRISGHDRIQELLVAINTSSTRIEQIDNTEAYKKLKCLCCKIGTDTWEILTRTGDDMVGRGLDATKAQNAIDTFFNNPQKYKHSTRFSGKKVRNDIDLNVHDIHRYEDAENESFCIMNLLHKKLLATIKDQPDPNNLKSFIYVKTPEYIDIGTIS
ncbi:MAG: hypothetical protein FWE01_00160 [Firmicutes bacterium]|nr:hypothetical protein [Bacillota bacterium]